MLLGYLGLIPVFGSLYYVMPGQNFYVPCTRLEPGALADAAISVKRNDAVLGETVCPERDGGPCSGRGGKKRTSIHW